VKWWGVFPWYLWPRLGTNGSKEETGLVIPAQWGKRRRIGEDYGKQLAHS
jgi:hypothetical protein